MIKSLATNNEDNSSKFHMLGVKGKVLNLKNVKKEGEKEKINNSNIGREFEKQVMGKLFGDWEQPIVKTEWAHPSHMNGRAYFSLAFYFLMTFFMYFKDADLILTCVCLEHLFSSLCAQYREIKAFHPLGLFGCKHF